VTINIEDVILRGSTAPASSVPFDPTTSPDSGIESTNVQDAIDELALRPVVNAATDVSFDPNTLPDTGVVATNVQDAIDELALRPVINSASDVSYDPTLPSPDSGLSATNVQDAIDELALHNVGRIKGDWTLQGFADSYNVLSFDADTGTLTAEDISASSDPFAGAVVIFNETDTYDTTFNRMMSLNLGAGHNPYVVALAGFINSEVAANEVIPAFQSIFLNSPGTLPTSFKFITAILWAQQFVTYDAIYNSAASTPAIVTDTGTALGGTTSSLVTGLFNLIDVSGSKQTGTVGFRSTDNNSTFVQMSAENTSITESNTNNIGTGFLNGRSVKPFYALISISALNPGNIHVAGNMTGIFDSTATLNAVTVPGGSSYDTTYSPNAQATFDGYYTLPATNVTAPTSTFPVDAQVNDLYRIVGSGLAYGINVTTDDIIVIDNITPGLESFRKLGFSTATSISYDPTYASPDSSIVSTTVQGAIDELDSRMSTLENDTINASEVVYSNGTSGLTATDAQAAIDEIDANLDNHLSDTTDAHDASAISYSNGSSGLTATDVQAAIDEVNDKTMITEVMIVDSSADNIVTFTTFHAAYTALSNYLGTTKVPGTIRVQSASVTVPITTASTTGLYLVNEKNISIIGNRATQSTLDFQYATSGQSSNAVVFDGPCFLENVIITSSGTVHGSYSGRVFDFTDVTAVHWKIGSNVTLKASTSGTGVENRIVYVEPELILTFDKNLLISNNTQTNRIYAPIGGLAAGSSEITIIGNGLTSELGVGEYYLFNKLTLNIIEQSTSFQGFETQTDSYVNGQNSSGVLKYTQLVHAGTRSAASPILLNRDLFGNLLFDIDTTSAVYSYSLGSNIPYPGNSPTPYSQYSIYNAPMKLKFVDKAGTFSTNAFTLGHGGVPLNGTNADIVVNSDYAVIEATFINNTTGWAVDITYPNDTANTANTLVFRDSNGDFDAGTITAEDNFVVSKAVNTGIKVDPAAPTFGWADITGMIIREEGGSNAPTLATYRGAIKQYQFGAADEVYVSFHLPHDYVPGTDVYIHAHWSHNDTDITGGSVTWGFEATYAKGFDQAAFPATVTRTVTQNASTTQYQHMMAETQLSVVGGSGTQLNTTDIEVDGIILCRAHLVSNDMTATVTAADPFLHFVDIHYQSTNVATKNKAPNFYS